MSIMQLAKAQICVMRPTSQKLWAPLLYFEFVFEFVADYFKFSRKGSVNARIKPPSFGTSNKFKKHCHIGFYLQILSPKNTFLLHKASKIVTQNGILVQTLYQSKGLETEQTLPSWIS